MTIRATTFLLAACALTATNGCNETGAKSDPSAFPTGVTAPPSARATPTASSAASLGVPDAGLSIADPPVALALANVDAGAASVEDTAAKDFASAVDALCACTDFGCVFSATEPAVTAAAKIAPGSPDVDALAKLADRMQQCIGAMPRPAGASPASFPPAVTYKAYANAQHRYSVDVGSVFGAGAAHLGAAGQQWKWRDKAVMTVSAVPGKGLSLAHWSDEAMAERKKAPAGESTGAHGRVSSAGKWFYVAGGWSGKAHWQKSVLKDDVLYTLRYDLDPNHNLSFAPIVARGLLSFKAP